MNKVTSKDGTKIAYEKRGTSPAVILVDGALCYRSFGPMTHLAELLVPHFSVYAYDRRGRGDSSNSKPYAVERVAEEGLWFRAGACHGDCPNPAICDSTQIEQR